MRPLEGLRAVEVSRGLAGSFAATLLADFGAEVVVVEDPAGHPLRQIPPFSQGASLFWAVEGRNKRSLCLEPEGKEGQELLRRLIRQADLLIEDRGPGVLEGWGIGWEELHRQNPELVLLRLSPFGQTGPYRDRPGGDRIAQALGGLTYVTGTPDLPPVSCGVAYADYLAGAFGALSSLIALYWREARGGEGQWIDLALYEPILRISEYTIPAYEGLGLIRERTGNKLPQSVAPGDGYRTRDSQWLVLTTVSDAIFARLSRAMGREELAQDPRFATGPKRVENGGAIEAMVREWVEGQTLEEVVTTLNRAEVPVNAVYDVAQVCLDPHVRARRIIVEARDLAGGEVPMQGVVPRLSTTPGEVAWAGPPLGRHQEEVLASLERAEREGRPRRPKAPGSRTGRALEGIRILEPATMGAGPFGPTLLGELGAEVIKMEIPGGETIRRLPPLLNGHSLFWADLHRNKRAVTLDLHRPEGQRLFLELARSADAVVENFRPGTFERWNLGYEKLEAANPRLVLVRVTGYGQDGPYSSQPGFDRIGLAFSGLMHLTGFPEGPPLRVGPAACDWLTGTFNAFGTMLALYWRDVRGGGRGQVVDCALYESVFRIQEATLAQYGRLGQVRGRQGNRHPSACPGDNHRARDGRWVAVFVTDERAFAGLARVLGREGWLDDPCYRDVQARRERQEEIEALVREWVGGREAEEAAGLLAEAGVSAFPVYSVADIVSDPHLAARGNLVGVDAPGIGPLRLPAPAPRLSLTPGEVRQPGPALGQDNREIYGDRLGRSPEELERLRQEKVI